MIIILIFIALITLPGQFQDIENLVNTRSQFHSGYKPSAGDHHVIVCGHANDKRKLSAFLQEFLHPDRSFSNSVLIHVVVLHPCEPRYHILLTLFVNVLQQVRLTFSLLLNIFSPEVIDMITSFYFCQKVTYVVGSSLVSDDLKNVCADSALGVFFLCDTEITEELAHYEDISTVTRCLSVFNFDANLSCFVQVLQPGEREILTNNGVEVILCLDEFKTTLLAKNSICPGVSTFIENLFHSFGGLSIAQENSLAPWHQEYIHGVHMEIYYILLSPELLNFVGHDFQALCDILFIEFETIIFGLASEDQSKIIFNPTTKDMKTEFQNWNDFFQVYNVAVVLADNNIHAEVIGQSINMPESFDGMMSHVTSKLSSGKYDKKRTYPSKYFNNMMKKDVGNKKSTRVGSTFLNKTLSRSSTILRKTILRKGNTPSLHSGRSQQMNIDNNNDSIEANDDEEFGSSDSNSEDDDEYCGFTKKVQYQRRTLRLSGHGNSLSTKHYIDTMRSLAPYRPKLMTHSGDDSTNPLTNMKLGELKRLHARGFDVDPQIRASARRKSQATLKAVASVVKMSRLFKNENSGTNAVILNSDQSPSSNSGETPVVKFSEVNNNDMNEFAIVSQTSDVDLTTNKVKGPRISLINRLAILKDRGRVAPILEISQEKVNDDNNSSGIIDDISEAYLRKNNIKLLFTAETSTVTGPPVSLLSSPVENIKIKKITCKAASQPVNSPPNLKNETVLKDDNSNHEEELPISQSIVNDLGHQAFRKPKKFTMYDSPSMKLNFDMNEEMISNEKDTNSGFIEVGVKKFFPDNRQSADTTKNMWMLDKDKGLEDCQSIESMNINGSDVVNGNGEYSGNGSDDDDDDESEEEDQFDVDFVPTKKPLSPTPLEPAAVYKVGSDDDRNVKCESTVESVESSTLQPLPVIKKLGLRKTRIQNLTTVKLGYSDDDDSSSVFSSDDEDDVDELTEAIGNPSREISDAMHLSNHIIVFGCSADNLLLFIGDLRYEVLKRIQLILIF